jgi:WD40 repeat protein
MKMALGMEAGAITGSAMALTCADLTAAPKSSDKTNLFSGGESGELFMHAGAPFQGAGKVVEKFAGDFIMAIKVCSETNRVYVATKNKKICVYDAQTTDKLVELADAHDKTIYGVALAPSSAEASFVTCSADNTVKTWKFEEESKSLTNLATISQVEGATQDLAK